VHCLADTALIPISTSDFYQTTQAEDSVGPEVVLVGLEHLEQIDFDRTTYTNDNLEAMSMLMMFAER